MYESETFVRTSFAAEHGWGWPHLVGRLADLRWLRPEAAAQAQAAIRDVLAHGAASVRDWADGRSVEVDRAYRNLIAESPAEDLTLWRLLLATPGVLPPELTARLAPVLSLLPEATGEGAAVDALATGRVPNVEAMEQLLDAAPRRLAEWTVRRHVETRPTASAGERIAVAFAASADERPRFRLQLIKRSLYLYPAPGPLDPDDLRGVSPADLYLLLRWPHLLDLLAGEGARTGSADGEAGATLTASILAWREAFRHQVWRQITAAVEARDITAACWGSFSRDQGMSRLPEALEGDFATALGGPYRGLSDSLDPAVLSRLASALPEPMGGLARLVLTAPAVRLAEIGALPGGSRRGVIAAAHLSELVAPFAIASRAASGADRPEEAAPDVQGNDDVDATPDAAPTEAVDLGRVSDIARAVADAGRTDEVLDALLGIGTAGGMFAEAVPVPGDVFTLWLASVEVPGPLVRACFARAGGRIAATREAAGNLDALERTGAPIDQLVDLLGNPVYRQQLARLNAEETFDLYLRLARRTRDEGWLLPPADAGPAEARLDSALQFMPAEVLLSALESGDLDDPRVRAAAQRVLTRDDVDAASTRLLDAASSLGRLLPNWLVAMVADDPRFIERALALRPVPVAAADLVLAGLRSRRVARLVDVWLTPESRLALLPWVREHFAAQPTLAAAYEVAVAFALSYGPYLVALGRMVKVPASPEERGHQFDHLYRTYELPKRSGGNRTITAPATGLKGLQRALLHRGFHTVPLADAATGFRPGRSIRDNAAVHVRQPVVVNIDIESFFPSTGYDLILRACRTLAAGHLSERAVRLIADVCAYQGALPTGAPTSPAIANIVLARIDQALATAAASRSVRYTRYADDLTFSGGGHALKLVPFARRLLKELGYELDSKKTNIYRHGRRQMVTGLVVNEKADLPRRTRRRLRAALHHREHGSAPTWHGKPMDDATLRGWFAYLAMLRPDDGRVALTRLEAAREAGS